MKDSEGQNKVDEVLRFVRHPAHGSPLVNQSGGGLPNHRQLAANRLTDAQQTQDVRPGSKAANVHLRLVPSAYWSNLDGSDLPPQEVVETHLHLGPAADSGIPYRTVTCWRAGFGAVPISWS